jgi:NADPH dehydrogenase (quinone)
MKHILIINAHQVYEGISTGQLNKTMAGVIREELEQRDLQVRQTNIEAGYDIETEVQNHVWADVIILQSPVFWFGTPWIYKKYIDEVFTAGMVQQLFIDGDGRSREQPERQYGTGGKLQGRKYMLSLTWNAPQAAFSSPSQDLFEGKSVDELFVMNTANYKFCGMQILPSFSAYDIFKAPTIENDIARLREHLRTHV